MNERLISWPGVSTGMLYCGTAGMVCMRGISTHEFTIKGRVTFITFLSQFVIFL